MKIKTHTLISVEREKFLAFINTFEVDRWGRCPVSVALGGEGDVYFRACANRRNPHCLNQLRPERNRHFSAPEIIPTNVQLFYPLELTNPTAVFIERMNDGRFETMDSDSKHPLWKKYEDSPNIFKVFLSSPIR